MSSLHKKRRGSFSKSGVGSQQLNELMLRYAQDNQISNMIGCIVKGADVDYKDGTLLLIACYLGRITLLKAILACEPVKGLGKARELLEKADDDTGLQLLNDYCARTGLGN